MQVLSLNSDVPFSFISSLLVLYCTVYVRCYSTVWKYFICCVFDVVTIVAFKNSSSTQFLSSQKRYSFFLTLLISLLNLCSDQTFLTEPYLCFPSGFSLAWPAPPCLSCCPLLLPLIAGFPPAKLMNGYMVLTNGGSLPHSLPSLSSRTFSRPAGDVIVSLEEEAPMRKMDTVVKLDAVRFSILLTQIC